MTQARTSLQSAPVDALYTIQDVARLTGARPEQLRRWDKSGLLPAVHPPEGPLSYRFQDLIAARTAIGLLEKGATTRQVREAVEVIRAWRPDVDQPLASLRVFSDQGRIVVRLDERLVEPRSGQLLLALPLEPAPATDGATVVRVDPPAPPEPQTAQEWIAWGLDAEDGPEGPAVAAERYRRALDIEPDHPGALLNLGNLAFAQGDLRAACEHYRAATDVAPDYAEAWYNLGNVLDDLGHPDAAVTAYRTALELSPDYADAHFNLALLWEKEGQRDRAAEHWRQYLQLRPEGESAALARRFLDPDG